MALLLTLDDLTQEYTCCIGAYLPPSCLSRFRAANSDYRHALQLTLVDALACSGVIGLNATARIAEKGSAGAIASVSARLEHVDWQVRVTAVQALAQIAEKGNADAIAAVSAHLEDAEWNVRRAAVLALAQMTEKGDADAITAVGERPR